VTGAVISCRRQAILAGERDGAADVHDWAIDQPIFYPHHPREDETSIDVPLTGWDEAAISASVAETVGVPRRWRGVYYSAYDRGSRRAALAYKRGVRS